MMDKSHRCTLMLLFNWAEPDWITISCDQKLLTRILCYVQSKILSKSKTKFKMSMTILFVHKMISWYIKYVMHLFGLIERREHKTFVKVLKDCHQT